MAEVREMTRNELIRARFVMSSSVIPSAKNCCSESFERFSRGRTAIDLTVGGRSFSAEVNLGRQPREFAPMSARRTATAKQTPIAEYKSRALVAKVANGSGGSSGAGSGDSGAGSGSTEVTCAMKR